METIVVGVDGSECSLDALRWAVDEGRRRQWALKAVLAWGFPDMVPVLSLFSDPELLQGQAEAQVGSWLRQEAGDAPGIEVSREAREGQAAGVLLDAAHDAGLLVVGSRGRGGLSSAVLGSVSQQCAQHARCPVVIVRRGDAAGRQHHPERATPRIVVGVDGSETARRALRWALDEARLRSAAVDVVHAWQMPYPDGYPVRAVIVPAADLEQAARRVLDAAVGGSDTAGVKEVEPLLVCDRAAGALLDTAKGADLLVVGSRGRGGFAGLLLGSVSQKVLHHADCPVVIVPPAID